MHGWLKLAAFGSDPNAANWYGARSRQEIFYQDYFENLATQHDNFGFHVALSAPLAEDQWTGLEGIIHDVVLAQYLKEHDKLDAVEFYLCGPPLMIAACQKMLASLGVTPMQIAYDEF
jgi:Na+-transporting NADH:ubiquinone oxidoreductase subunit F